MALEFPEREAPSVIPYGAITTGHGRGERVREKMGEDGEKVG